MNYIKISNDQKVEYEWVVISDEQVVLAHKKYGENPIFIDAEAAVLQLIKSMKIEQHTNKKIMHLLLDLSRSIDI